MKNKSKSLVLLSGGQDSVTCLAVALTHSSHVEAIFFNYGQRHDIEREKAKEIARLAGISLTEIDATFIAQLAPNALTDKSIDIEHKEGELPSTFVPGRNLFFLSIAGVVARQKKLDTIYTGVCQTDYSGYPDCRKDFIDAAEKAINLAMESTLEIKTPLMGLTKAQTVLLMRDLDKLEWYAHTHTCYEGDSLACGRCPACKLRLNGFKEADIKDPIPYGHEKDT